MHLSKASTTSTSGKLTTNVRPAQRVPKLSTLPQISTWHQQSWQQRHLEPSKATSTSRGVTADSVTQEGLEDDKYKTTQQAAYRQSWASSVRSVTGRQHHAMWQPKLDPPLLLEAVTVVLVGPKKPVSCGTVARSCSCFEVSDMRVVLPRCQPNSRISRSVSKGGQWVLYRCKNFDTLSDALADASLTVAMTRWLPDQQGVNAMPDIPSLIRHPMVEQLLQQPLTPPSTSGRQQQQHKQQPTQQHQQQQPRIALVFGREDYGLSDDEVAACDVSCAIPIGRLQESLSLSHAVTITLSQLYQARLAATAGDPAAAACRVAPPALLADRYDSSSGTEQ